MRVNTEYSHNTKENQGDFYTKLVYFLKDTYPDQFENFHLENHNFRIEKYEDLFLYLDEIYEYRRRYDLHWALNEAHERMNLMVEETTEKVRSYLEEELNSEEFAKFSILSAEMAIISEDVNRKVSHILTKFRTISFLVSLIDIIISVILIIIISHFAHLGNSLVNSIIIGFLFTGFIAFFKVTLDRFYIIPKVKEWGWKKYLKEVQITKQTLVEAKAISIIVMESIRIKDEPEVTYSLFRKGIHRMSQI